MLAQTTSARSIWLLFGHLSLRVHSWCPRDLFWGLRAAF